MRLTVLTDNNTFIDRYLLGEPAFSVLLEDGETTVLFDTGYSDVFMENARRLGIDLGRVTDIVLSHGHNDHTGGLKLFTESFRQPVVLTAHPGVFDERFDNGLSVGAPVTKRELEDRVTFRLTKTPVWLNSHICFLGEIPRRYSFEQNRAVGTRSEGGRLIPDTIPDDSSLAIRTEEGLFLLSGCAHAGIVNTLAYALEVTGEKKIHAVFGGMHLFQTDGDLAAAEDALAAFGVRSVYPCHCTSLAVRAAMMQRFSVTETGAGLALDL